jgi:hypothetical protein
MEGMVRLCASFTDTVVGVLPLYLLERIYAKIRGQKDPRPLGAPDFTQSNLFSYVSTLQDKMVTERQPELPDELCAYTLDNQEFFEIRSSHPKSDWDPPRTVRYGDRYYRLEESLRGAAPRPFVYKLRRVSKGVPGRTVIVYQPEQEPVISGR